MLGGWDRKESWPMLFKQSEVGLMGGGGRKEGKAGGGEARIRPEMFEVDRWGDI